MYRNDENAFLLECANEFSSRHVSCHLLKCSRIFREMFLLRGPSGGISSSFVVMANARGVARHGMNFDLEFKYGPWSPQVLSWIRYADLTAGGDAQR